MSRWSQGSCLWRLCCCGCIGPILFIKLIFIVTGVTIFSVLAATLIGVFFLIYGSPQFFYTILKLPKLGLKVKIFFAILFIIPTVLFLPVFILLGTFLGIIFSFYFTVDVTMDPGKSIFWGLNEIPADISRMLKDIIDGMNEILNDELRRARDNTLRPGEVPWDVYWSDLFGCLITFTIALGFLFPSWMIIVILKFLPFTMRLYIEFWRNFCDSHHGCCGWVCMGILFFFGNILLPVVPLCCAVICMFHGLACCFYSIYVCYDYSFITTLKYMCAVIHRYDAQTYRVIMGRWKGGRHDTPDKSIFDLCGCCVFDRDVMTYAESMVSL